jgi:hypothetical protein
MWVFLMCVCVCVCALYAVNISGQSLMMYWSVNFYLVVNEYHVHTTQPDSIQVIAFFLFLFLLFEGGGIVVVWEVYV